MFWSNSKIILNTILFVILGILFIVFIFPDGNLKKQDTDEILKVEPKIEKPDFVTFTFGGDIMLDRGVRKVVEKNFAGDYSRIFENLDMLHDSDIVFANLEGTASDQGRHGGGIYSFHMDPLVIPAMKNAGIDILSIANNHVGDWGRAAYTDTIARLNENGIRFTGGGMNELSAKEPTIIEKNGMRIGFLAFSDKGPNWMEVKKDTAGLLIADREDFSEVIENASKQVDHLIVSFHFGEEYQKIHDKRQKYLAHVAVDNGAKIVIGHHPHVIQDFEIYKDGYIAYSLGNFIFDQSWSEPTMQGLLLHIKLKRDGSLSARKDTFKLNNFFQPSDIITGTEEEINFTSQ